MGNRVEICGLDTSKIPLLTAEEKRELFIKIKKGDKKNHEKQKQQSEQKFSELSEFPKFSEQELQQQQKLRQKQQS